MISDCDEMIENLGFADFECALDADQNPVELEDSTNGETQK